MVKTTLLGAKEAWMREVRNAFDLVKTSDKIIGFRIEGIYIVYSLYDDDGNTIIYPGKLKNINVDIENMVELKRYPLSTFVLDSMMNIDRTDKYVIRIQSEEFEEIS